MLARSLSITIIATFLLGCTENRMLRNLAAHLASQKQDAASLDVQLDSAPMTSIGWKDALTKMHSSNLGLIQSRNQLEQARKQPKREWLGLVPRLSGFVSLGDSISELTNLSSNLDARLVANFTIPNPVEFYATLYGAELQKQGAIWSNELDERRAYIQLYSLFIESESIQEAEQRLISTQRSFSSVPVEDLEKASQSFFTDRDQLMSRRRYHRLAINRMFNTPGGNWNLVGRPPSIGYENRYQNLRFSNDFGKLGLNLQAIQIEAAQLSVYRVRYRQWPSINFGLSTPSLYSNQDTGTGFSGDNTYLFSSVSKTIDYTDLGGARSVKEAKERLQFTRAQLRQRMEEETMRVKELSRTYSRLVTERNLIEKQLARIPKSSSTDYSVLAQQLVEINEQKNRLSQLQTRITQLDLQLLIWDEKYWKN